MKGKSPELKVGLLVIVALLGLVYMSLKVGGAGTGLLGGGGYRIYLPMENASGLLEGADVMVAGIRVGQVEKIVLEDGKTALASLFIREDVQLPDDSTGTLNTRGVLGEVFVSLRPGLSEAMLIDQARLRPGHTEGDVGQMVDAVHKVAYNLSKVTERLARVLGTDEGEEQMRNIVADVEGTVAELRVIVTENRESLRTAIANFGEASASVRNLIDQNRREIDETLANARELSGSLTEVVDENRAELREAITAFRRAAEQLDETFKEVNALTKELRGSEGTIGKLMHDDQLYDDVSESAAMLKNMLANLEEGEGTLGKLLTDDEMQNRLDQSLANIEEITAKVNEGKGTIGKLVNDDELYDNLSETMETVNEFVTRSNEFRFQVGYRGDFLAEASDVKNYYSVAIWPRLDRFYLLEVVDDPRGKESTTTIIREITDDMGNTTTTTELETKIEDELKFSAQVGKRFGGVTLRGGLFESTGGVAADLDLFDDQLRVTLELFDFGGNDDWTPHAKAWARLLIWKHLMLTAGFDDFLDGGGDEDYFFGGGLTFFDDDLKYLLAPAANLAQ